MARAAIFPERFPSVASFSVPVRDDGKNQSGPVFIRMTQARNPDNCNGGNPQ